MGTNGNSRKASVHPMRPHLQANLSASSQTVTARVFFVRILILRTSRQWRGIGRNVRYDGNKKRMASSTVTASRGELFQTERSAGPCEPANSFRGSSIIQHTPRCHSFVKRRRRQSASSIGLTLIKRSSEYGPHPLRSSVDLKLGKPVRTAYRLFSSSETFVDVLIDSTKGVLVFWFWPSLR